MKPIEIVVAGGGPVGLATAALIAADDAGDACRITVVEGAAARRWNSATTDLRVYALSRAAEQVLAAAGAWNAIAAARTSPYTAMRIWEGATPETAGWLRFDAADIGAPELGHIVEDSLIREALCSALERARGVRVEFESEIEAIDIHERRIDVSVRGSSAPLRAHLLIGADGGRSRVRTAAALPGIERDYRQQAIVAHVIPERSHADTAWQRFLSGGPLALLPLSDGRCSIVWSLPGEQANALATCGAAQFQRHLSLASAQLLGRLQLDSPRVTLPLFARHAVRYCRARLALAGDAAHTVHPLAGQGVNLGLADAAELAHQVCAAVAAGQDPGDLRILRRYERARTAPNLMMLGALDGLDRLFRAPRMLAPLRAAGLGLVDRLPLLKRAVMRHAVGTSELSP